MQLAMGTGRAAGAQVRKLPDRLSRDRSLRRRVQLIEEKFGRIKKDRRAEGIRQKA
jgi:hypothetical protein